MTALVGGEGEQIDRGSPRGRGGREARERSSDPLNALNWSLAQRLLLRVTRYRCAMDGTPRHVGEH